MAPFTTPPASCTSLEELRAHLDALDRRIVAALVQRMAYSRELARFVSSDAGGIESRQRAETAVVRARALARQSGADPELIEAVYRVLYDADGRYQPLTYDVLQAEAMRAR